MTLKWIGDEISRLDSQENTTRWCSEKPEWIVGMIKCLVGKLSIKKAFYQWWDGPQDRTKKNSEW